MATTISTGNGDNDTITGVRIDIARLEGLVTGFLTDGLRRIENGEKTSEKLRSDLDAVKENCHTEVSLVSARVAVNAENVKDIREDVKGLKENQNSSFNRVLAVIASIVASASLLWNVIGK
jgi:hypothetical protein